MNLPRAHDWLRPGSRPPTSGSGPHGLPEIEKESWTLNISRYVVPQIGEDIPPLQEAVVEFKQVLARCREAEDHLRGLIKEGGWLS